MNSMEFKPFQSNLKGFKGMESPSIVQRCPKRCFWSIIIQKFVWKHEILCDNMSLNDIQLNQYIYNKLLVKLTQTTIKRKFKQIYTCYCDNTIKPKWNLWSTNYKTHPYRDHCMYSKEPLGFHTTCRIDLVSNYKP